MASSSSSLADILSNASLTASAWYNAVSTGSPVVPITPGETLAQQAAASQIALQQSQQSILGATNPTLAGLLANPTLILFIGIIILAIVAYFLFKK